MNLFKILRTKVIPNQSFLIGLFILCLAAAFRFWMLGSVPVALYWDETAMSIDAWSVAQTGRDMHNQAWWQVIYPSYGDFKLPVYIWASSLSFWIFGHSEWALRLPSALAGLGTVLVAGGIAYLLSDFKNQDQRRKIQLATMAVVALSPWSIGFSRTAFEGHLGQFFLALSILILLWLRKCHMRVVMAAVLGAVATYTYFSVRFVWPVLAVIATLWSDPSPFPLDKVRFKPFLGWILKVGVMLVVFTGLLYPMFKSPLYEVSNSFRLSTSSVLNSADYPLISNQFRALAGNTFLDRVLFHRDFLLIRELAKNYSDNLSLNFLFVSGDPNLRHGTGQHGLFLLPFLPLLFVGIYQLRKRFLVLLLLGSWIILGLLPASVPETTPHALRSLNALLPFSILIGWGGAAIWDWQSKNHLFGKIFKLGLLASMVLAVLEFSVFYFNIYPQISAYDWQDGYTQLSVSIFEEFPEAKSVWIHDTEDRLYLWLLNADQFSAQEIQAMEKVDYKMSKVGKVYFENVVWNNIGNDDWPVAVAGSSPYMEGFVLQNQGEYRLIRDKIIKSHDGVDRFTILLVDRIEKP